MRAPALASALLLLLVPSLPASASLEPAWLDDLRGLLRERGGHLDGMGTLTTLTPDGPVTREVRNADVVAALLPALAPAGTDHIVVPGTWGVGEYKLGTVLGGFCAPVYLFAVVYGNPRDYYHATPSDLNGEIGRLYPKPCGGYWGHTDSWKDITINLHQGTSYGACGGAMLLIEPGAGAVGPGQRCGWKEACFSGDATANFWGPGFAIHILFALGQVGTIVMGNQHLPETPTYPPYLLASDTPCAPGYPV